MTNIRRRHCCHRAEKYTLCLLNRQLVRLFCVRADTPVLTIWQIVCTHMFRSHCLVFVLFVVGFTRLGWQTYEVVLNLTRFAAKPKPYTKPQWGNIQSASNVYCFGSLMDQVMCTCCYILELVTTLVQSRFATATYTSHI